MAIESQGIVLRRQSTTANSTASSSGLTIYFSSAGGDGNTSTTILRSDAGDFTADNWSTGMRLISDDSSNSTKIFTVHTVAATAMGIYESAAPTSTGTNIALTGYAFEDIGQVTGFNGPSGSAGVIDVTSLASTSKEKLVGLRDEGQVSLDVLFDPATADASKHNALRTDRETRTKRIFDIKLTDNDSSGNSQPTAHYFSGYVTGFAITGAVDDAVKGSVTLEISSSVRTINRN